MNTKKWSNWRVSRKPLTLGIAMLSGLVFAGSALPAFAQGPNQQPGGPIIVASVGGPGATQCSTTDYTDVAAKVLGMTAPELRLALTSGKTLQDLATSKNVTLQSVTDAVDKARQADLEQAVKDGLLSQDVLNVVKGNTGNGPNPSTQSGPATPSAAPQGGSQPPQNGPQNSQPGQGTQGGPQGNNQPGDQRGGRRQQGPGMFTVTFAGPGRNGAGISLRNVPHSIVAAAQAVGMSCPDLVKATRQGKSIVQVATEKNIQAQTVIDAIVKSYKDALTADVKEGLITQAQADGQSVRLVEQATAMISRSGGEMGMDIVVGGAGFGFGDGPDVMLPQPALPGMPGQPGERGQGFGQRQFVQPGKPGQQPDQPDPRGQNDATAGLDSTSQVQ